ncbi:MAG: energy-coupled thiamine transporter ThiT, partial [Clostridiales bacterium]|nr:energy-coupled thiamine transporter ThiT [Clostridiales bacterium]
MYKFFSSLSGVSKLFDFDDFRDADTMLRVTLVLCLCLFVALIAGTLIAYFVLRKKGKTNVIRTRDITYGAICLASSYALSFLGVGMPYGGTVTFASVLPVMIYCYYFGFFKGLVVTAAYTVLQFFQSPSIVHPMSAVLDYVIPYLALIFLGIFSYRQARFNKTVAANKHPLCAHIPFFIGIACYFAVRYISHVLSGVLFWGDYIAWDGWWQNHLWAYS